MIVEEKIIELFCQCLPSPIDSATVDPAMPLSDMALVDSVMLLRLMTTIEKEFSISFDLKDLNESFYSLKSVATYIEKKQALH